MKNIIIIFLLTTFSNLNAQIKIVCDDVELATKPLKEVSYVKAIESRIGGKFESCELKFRKKSLVETELHPFIDCLYIAYSDHRRITITPDMIWLLICQGFSIHVNNNVEELRNKFVAFNDKKKLKVETEHISIEFVKGSISSPWSLAFPSMSDSISKYVKSDIHNLYIQSFSTTTIAEKSAYEIALLDVMSGYFEYEYETACGIPEINIEGTKEDWLKIQNNIRKFKGYEIDNWINSLEPIIQQFVNASNNKIDQPFWSNIFKRKDESGGPYITGWIIKFFPYISEGNQKMVKNPYLDREPKEFMEGLVTNNFNNGLSKADFIWNYYEKEYKMEFLSGFIGIKQDKNTLTLKPEIGWLVKDKNNIKIPIISQKIINESTTIENENLNDVVEKSNTNGKIQIIVFLGILLFALIIYFKTRKK